MDKLAEWGIAAYHSGRWVAEREFEAMGSNAHKVGNGAAAGYPTSNSPGSSTCLNDADIARRVSTTKETLACLSCEFEEHNWDFLKNFGKESFLNYFAGELAQIYSRLARRICREYDIQGVCRYCDW